MKLIIFVVKYFCVWKHCCKTIIVYIILKMQRMMSCNWICGPCFVRLRVSLSAGCLILIVLLVVRLITEDVVTNQIDEYERSLNKSAIGCTLLLNCGWWLRVTWCACKIASHVVAFYTECLLYIRPQGSKHMEGVFLMYLNMYCVII